MSIRGSAADASLKVKDQHGVTDSLSVSAVKAPEAAWVVVHLDDNGKPGARIGLLNIPRGESADLTVPLKSDKPLTDKLIVAMHADRATPGTFDFVMDKFDASPEKPYGADGQELATFINVK